MERPEAEQTGASESNLSFLNWTVRDVSTPLRFAQHDKKDPMNLNKLMKQAQKMQEQMAKTQAELETKTVEVSAAGGKVKVTANGAGDVVAIKIDKEVVDPNDVEFLEEMILSAVQQAVEQGKALAQSEMSKLTGGLSIPGLQ
jgi:DNA-binding YbaB/EbfC family protein